MTRVATGIRRHRQHKKILDLAKGYRGARNRLFKKANEAVMRAGEHAFHGRRKRRRDARRLWIIKINAALLPFNIKYSRFIDALQKSNIKLDRKSLADMAVNDAKAFEKVVNLCSENFAK